MDYFSLSVRWKPLHSQIFQELKSKTGIYFNEMGIIFFYPTKWRVVTYVDLEPTLELWVQTKAHHIKIRNFCKKIKDNDWYSSTDCIAFDEYMKSKNKYIDNLKDFIVEHLKKGRNKYVNLLNEQLRMIQRSVDECQHSFEMLIDVFIHAEQGILQPQLIPMKKIRKYIMKQKLPSGMDYPNFPFPETLKIITPSIYSYKKYLVYVLEIPLIFLTEYHLYKLIPFPVVVNKKEATYGYINLNKELIFSDSLSHYGKMNTNRPSEVFSAKADGLLM
jgi:hypothetical protein